MGPPKFFGSPKIFQKIEMLTVKSWCNEYDKNRNADCEKLYIDYDKNRNADYHYHIMTVIKR